MKKNNERMSRKLHVRITALLLAFLMVLFTMPSDVIASITEVSDYQEMEEESEAESDSTILEVDSIEDEENLEELKEETQTTTEDEISDTEAAVVESIIEENESLVITEVTTEVSNDEFDIIIIDKTEGALSEVSEVLVEDKTTEVSDSIIEQIAEKENLDIDEMVTKTLNIELKDNNQDETQPEGTVTVSIAIPEEMNEEDFSMYYIGNGEENPTKVEGTIEDGYFTFERSHFCQFCLVSTGSGVKIGQDIDYNSNSKLQNANIGWYVNAVDPDNASKTGANSDTFYISTGADLRGLALLTQGNVYYEDSDAHGKVDNFGDVAATSSSTTNMAPQTTFAGKTIILTNDISMNSDEGFTGIGTKDYPFKGTFDGNGYCIKNIAIGDVYAKKADGTYDRDNNNNKKIVQQEVLQKELNAENQAIASYIGLFNFVDQATIKNLGIENAQVVVSAQNTNNNGYEPVYAAVLIAKDLATSASSSSTTKLSNIYIYNSKVSIRESTHRTLYEAGFVASGEYTVIQNAYTMKLTLTGTKADSISNQTLKQASIAILSGNYSNLSKVYYMETIYGLDNVTNPYEGNALEKTEELFTDDTAAGVTSLINAGESHNIFELIEKNPTHPTFTRDTNITSKTTARVTVATVHNGSLSGAGGTFRIKENENGSFGDYSTNKTLRISKGYESFDSDNNNVADAYLLLRAYTKDSGYTFEGWYKGMEIRETYTYKTEQIIALSSGEVKDSQNNPITSYTDGSGASYENAKITKTLDVTIRKNADGNQIEKIEEENTLLRKVEYTNDATTTDPSTVAGSETTHKTKNYYGTTRVSTDTEYYVQDNNFEDVTYYAVFSGSPYTVSALLADISCPYAPDATDEQKTNAVNTLISNMNSGSTKRAEINYKADPYSEEQVKVLEEDGVTQKQDENGNPLWKTKSSGNIIGTLSSGSAANYVTTWDINKNGEITLYCNPEPGYAFVGWYESDNRDPFESSTDVLISDSKENNCAVTIKNVKSNRIIKCIVTKAIPVYTFFTEAGTGNEYNGNMTTWDVDLSDTENGTNTTEYNIYSTYGKVSIKENGTYPANAAAAKQPTMIGIGGAYTLSARSENSRRFVGWFSVPNPTIDPATNDYTKDAQGKYTQLLSTDNDFSIIMDPLESDSYKVYYARFERQQECIVKQDANVITLEDEGITTRRVTYQYSGTEAYAYPNWTAYTYNGLGKQKTAQNTWVDKSDYATHQTEYAWNGSEGYHQFLLNTTKKTGIDGKEVVLPYAGHYTFCFWPADGSVMYTKDVVVEAADIDPSRSPSIEQVGTTAQYKIKANGHKINNVFYQLTWTPTSNSAVALTDGEKDTLLAAQTACTPLFSTWYRYVKTGQAESVSSVNGANGYIEVGPDCGGEVISLGEVGWYTFYVKYDDNKSDVYYVKVASTNINGTATTTPPSRDTLEDKNSNGSIRVISKYSKQNVGIAIVQGYFDNIAGAANQTSGSYGMRFTAEDGSDTKVVWQSGNRNAKTYIVNATNLVAGKNYKVEAIYKDASGNTQLVDQTSVPPLTMPAIAATVSSSNGSGTGYNDYYGNTAGGTSYSFRSNYYSGGVSIDTHGAYDLISGKSGTILTTYSSQGWAVQSSSSDVETIPTARIVKGTSQSEYVLFTYVLHNNTGNTINNYKIGFSADTMIYRNDYAPVSKEEFGFRICDSNDPNNQEAINFVLIANSECNTDGVGQYTDTCSSKWFGYYSYAYSNAYNEIPDGATYGGDSGAAFSYQNMTFTPGEVKTISFILGVAPTSSLGTVDRNVPKPYIEKAGSLGTAKANSTNDIEFRINKITYQYTTNDNSSTTNAPFAFTDFAESKGSVPQTQGTSVEDGTGTRANSGLKLAYGTDAYSLTEFAQKGISNKALNTGTGYKTLFEEKGYNYQYVPGGATDDDKSKNMYDYLTAKASTFYEEETTVNGVTKQQNNLMEFEEPGWYTFLIDYYEVYKANENDKDVYKANRYLKEINIYVSSADLNGTPYIVKYGNMIQIYNHSSNLYSVTYQLTNTDETLAECSPLYTTWSEFWHTGQGLELGAENAVTHNREWIQKSDYRVYTKVNSKNGYKTITKNLETDGPQGARQLVFTTPGWYTFKLNYKTAAGVQRTVVKYALITTDDIENGGPRLDVTGNKITLAENDSNVTKVVYQLTTTDPMYMETAGGVSIDDYPSTVDTDKNNNGQARNYIKWEKLDGYPVNGSDDDKLAYKYWIDGSTNEEEFLYMYEYGEGFYYTTVADKLYKKSASTSDWTVFTKIGKADLSDYEQDKQSDYLIKANYTTGYRTMKQVTVHDDFKNQDVKTYDNASVEVQTPGWYTFLITYGDGVTVAKYIQITEDDINSAPTASIDQNTGKITVDTDTYDVLNAYISYATNKYLDREGYPSNESGMNYYLDANNKYTWTGFYRYGVTTTEFKEQNGDDGYRTMLSTKRESSDFVDDLRYVVNWAGWYNVYITYVVGGEKKVIVRHVKLENDVAGPIVKQITSDMVITDKDGKLQNDNRMAIVYEDNINNTTYPITKYAIGYFAYNPDTFTTDAVTGKNTPKNISTWYRMALATTDVRSVKGDAINVTDITNSGTVTGRTFNFPVDREGYYVVMVIDAYYGLRVYTTEVKDVPVLDDTVEYAPKLYVSTKDITGVAAYYNNQSGAEVAYLKDITGMSTTRSDINYITDAVNKAMATKGNVLKIKTVGTKTIRTVAQDGRVYDLTAVVDSATSDSTDLEKLIEKARKYLNTYHHYELDSNNEENTTKPIQDALFSDHYVDEKVPGAWAEYDAWEALNTAVTAAVDLINYDGKILKENFTAPSQTQIDTAYTNLYNAIYDETTGFEKWSVVNEEEFVKVEGDKITVLAGDLVASGRNVEYVIYCAKNVYDISTVINQDFAYRPINATVWDSWAGISSSALSNYEDCGEYNKFNGPTENIVIEDVSDGVYTFQIKVDGVVYYQNPVVHNTETNSLKVVKTYLGGSDGTGGLIDEANDLLSDAFTKEQYDQDNTKVPYISSSWKKILQNEINTAKLYYQHAGETRYNKGTSYKPNYIYCDEDGVISETANLHNVMRKFVAALSYGDLNHTIHLMKNGAETAPDANNDFGTITSTSGVVQAINNFSTGNAKATKIIVAKGKLSSWSQMSSAGTTIYTWEANGDNKLKSDITVHANGTYTIYVKYEDNVYEFYYFTVSGYSYPITAVYNNTSGKIDITVKAGTKISELQLADGTYTAYTKVTSLVNGFETQTGTDQAFRDIWYKYPTGVEPTAANRSKRTVSKYAEKIGGSGYTSEQFTISEERLSISEHTVYAKILNDTTGEYEEFFIPVEVSVNPMIMTDYHGVDTTITAMTSVGNVAWVAYAAGDHVTGKTDHWDSMVAANGGVKYIAQNKPVKIDGLTGTSDVFTFYFKGTKNGAIQNDNYIVVIGQDGGVAKYHNGTVDTSYHTGAKTTQSTNDVFAVSQTSANGITLSKTFNASSDGTKIAYYKIATTAPSAGESADYIAVPANSTTITIPLPDGVTTSAGDTVNYSITFYDASKTQVGTALTGTYTVSSEAVNDVYAVKSASDSGIVIYKVNNQSGSGKSITKYTVQVKDVNTTDDSYTEAGAKAAISGLTAGTIAIPTSYISGRSGATAGVDYKICLYDDSNTDPVQTITGTYDLVVNADYKVVKAGTTATDRTVTLTTATTRQAANGGKTAVKYAIYYANSTGAAVEEVVDDSNNPVTGAMATTITFKNLKCYDKILVKFYDSAEATTEFTTAVCTVSDIADEKWNVTGSRDYGSATLKLTLKRTSQAKNGGKQIATYTITNHSTGANIAANQAIGTYTAPIEFSSNNAATSVDVYLMTSTGENLYIYRDVQIKAPDPVDDVYAIRKIDTSNIVLYKKTAAKYGGKVATKVNVTIGETNLGDTDLASGDTTIDITSVTLGKAAGTVLNYSISFKNDSGLISGMTLTDTYTIPTDEVFEFVSIDADKIKFKRSTIAQNGGIQAAKYTIKISDNSNTTNVETIIDNKDVPGGTNIIINYGAKLTAAATTWGWTSPGNTHTLKYEILFYNENGDVISTETLTGTYTYTVPTPSP